MGLEFILYQTKPGGSLEIEIKTLCLQIEFFAGWTFSKSFKAINNIQSTVEWADILLFILQKP